MKDELKSILSDVDVSNRLNVAREYLQSYVLLILQRYDFFRIAAFVGGTCLRIVYGIPRFSEDLDFSLLIKKEDFRFIELIRDIKKELELAGYSLDISYKDSSNVFNAMLKFEGIMNEFGISRNVSQKLSIKLDIDTCPPMGATLNTSLITKFFPLTIVHYDMGSILAGKMNALLTRSYIKGRDYFDIYWIMSLNAKIVPNIALLNNALAQFKNPVIVTAENWAPMILKVIEGSNMTIISKDVAPFIEKSVFLASFNMEGFRLLFEKYT
jgi:predicted nucleotidyltransferase component of viral defense system